MKILVVGRSGHLARALSAEDPALMCMGRDALDLSDAATTESAVLAYAPDLIVNAAAYTDVERAEDEPDAAFAVNSRGVAALARGAAGVGAALIHISTDYVFDGTKVGEWTETDPTGPLNVYGASKLAGEKGALMANSRTLILRTSWVYSPWGRNFVTKMLEFANCDRLTVVADQRGKPTSALSLARAILAIAPRVAATPSGESLWGIRHYAGCGVASRAEFARTIFALAQGRLAERVPDVVPITTASDGTRARRPLNSALDCAAFEADFGIATCSWRSALAEVIDRIAAERRAS